MTYQINSVLPCRTLFFCVHFLFLYIKVYALDNMLEYKILEKKTPVRLIKNGEIYNCIDLLSDTYVRNIGIAGTPIIVNEYYIARPDLISQAMYGTDKYTDILCKINGISNPFELNENMMVFCPTVDYLTKLIKSDVPPSALIDKNASKASGRNSNGTTENNIQSKLINKNESTIEKQNSTTQKLKSERRSPAEQTIDDNNYIIDKSLGIVIY